MSLLESEITRAYDAYLLRAAESAKKAAKQERQFIIEKTKTYYKALINCLGFPLIKELRKLGMRNEGGDINNYPHVVFPFCDADITIYYGSSAFKVKHHPHEYGECTEADETSDWIHQENFRELLLASLGGLRATYQAKQKAKADTEAIATSDADTSTVNPIDSRVYQLFE